MMVHNLYKFLLHSSLFLAFFGPNLHYGVDLTYAAGIAVIIFSSLYLRRVTVPAAVFQLIFSVVIAVIFTLFLQTVKGGALSDSFMAFHYLKFGFFLLVAYSSHIILTVPLGVKKAEDQIMTGVNYIIFSAILTLFVNIFIGESIYREYVNLHLYKVSIRSSELILNRFTDLSIGGAAISLIYAVGLVGFFQFRREKRLGLQAINTILAPSILIAAVVLTGRTGIVVAFIGSFYFLILNQNKLKVVFQFMLFLFSVISITGLLGRYLLDVLSINSETVEWALQIFQFGNVASFTVLMSGLREVDLGSMTMFGSADEMLYTKSGWAIDSFFVWTLNAMGYVGLMILFYIMFFCFFFVKWRIKKFNTLGFLILILLIVANVKEEFFGGVRGGMALILFMLINCSSLNVQPRIR